MNSLEAFSARAVLDIRGDALLRQVTANIDAPAMQLSNAVASGNRCNSAASGLYTMTLSV